MRYISFMKLSQENSSLGGEEVGAILQDIYDVIEYGDSLRQFNTNVVEEDMDYLLTHCKKRIWIGNNQSQIFSKFGRNHYQLL